MKRKYVSDATPPPAWHAQSVDEVSHAQSVVPGTGLDRQEAARRLEAYGRNSLPAPKRRGPWLRFAQQFHNPLIYVLLGAGVITFLLEDYVDAGVIIGVVLIN
ncbi:MAG: cation-transporting P-type ATPase, partial [Gammaproteobacteria bacterium]|nr:cation-transporting P-type ATPase [Gammaproteobacteria bacterium]